MTQPIVLFVEDPGAANFVAGLPAALADRGFEARLFASGPGARHLDALRTPHTAIAEAASDVQLLIGDLHASALVVGTSENLDSLAFPLTAAARGAGCPSVGVIDGPANAAYRFRGRTEAPLAHAPDWILVPDTFVQQQFAALGFPPDHLKVVGHPHYDYVMGLRPAFDKLGRAALRARHFPEAGRRKVVLFLAELSDGLDADQYQRGPSYTLRGRGTSSRRTDVSLEETLDAVRRNHPDAYFVLRLHPKNTLEEFAPYLAEVDLVSRGGSAADVLQAVYAADLVAGLTSMLLLEGAILGRPTVSVVPRESEAHRLPSIAMGLTTCVTERNALDAEIERWLAAGDRQSPPRAEDCIEFGATERVCSFLGHVAPDARR